MILRTVQSTGPRDGFALKIDSDVNLVGFVTSANLALLSKDPADTIANNFTLVPTARETDSIIAIWVSFQIFFNVFAPVQLAKGSVVYISVDGASSSQLWLDDSIS